MKRLEILDLDAADVKRLDEILSAHGGQGLAAEAAFWRRQRQRHWIAAVSLGLLLLVLATGSAYLQWWA